MLVHSLLSILTVTAFALGSPVGIVREVATFTPDVWLENLAVRASGELLVTLIDVPEVWSINPVSGRSVCVARFPDATSVFGITEAEPDVFAVAAGNQSEGFPSPGTSSLWTVDFRHKKQRVTKVAAIPSASFLNGLTTLRGGHAVLAADSLSGTIFKIDLPSGRTTSLFSGGPFAAPPQAAFQFGVNGVFVKSSWLYFTNSGAGTFSCVPIHPNGSPAGPVESLTTGLELPDDFALSANGIAYITVHETRSLEAVDAKGVRAHIAGGTNSTQFAKPTAVKYGRTPEDRSTLYVTTGGLRDENGAPVTNGKILAVTIR